MKASKIDENKVDEYVEEMKRIGSVISIEGLLQWATPKRYGGEGGEGGEGGKGEGGEDDEDALTHECPRCGCFITCEFRGDA